MAAFLSGALYAQDTIESEFPVENLFYNREPLRAGTCSYISYQPEIPFP